MVALLVSMLILVVLAVVVFLVVKWLLAEAEVGDPIRKIVLLILLLVFLIGVVYILTGHRFFDV